jgi:NADPH-dependent 2,4-dienoyl-CoA reductase/sulfur reductase-like enzyme
MYARKLGSAVQTDPDYSVSTFSIETFHLFRKGKDREQKIRRDEITMSRFILQQREIPLDDRWDVVVVGGGPAGCTSAISAAREGAKTLLIEATGALGGMGTNGLVPAWCPFSDKERVIYGGLGEKILETLKSTMPHVPKDAVDWVPIDPERLKALYDDLVIESGASIMFHTVLSAVETDGNGTVTGIVVSNKSGLSAYKAKTYVDCTGDGDLAVWAGAEYEKGGDNGELQPASHCFIISNVDSYGYLYGPRLHSATRRVRSMS